MQKLNINSEAKQLSNAHSKIKLFFTKNVTYYLYHITTITIIKYSQMLVMKRGLAKQQRREFTSERIIKPKDMIFPQYNTIAWVQFRRIWNETAIEVAFRSTNWLDGNNIYKREMRITLLHSRLAN